MSIYLSSRHHGPQHHVEGFANYSFLVVNISKNRKIGNFVDIDHIQGGKKSQRNIVKEIICSNMYLTCA